MGAPARHGRLVVAVLAAVLVVISAPFIGQIRGAVQAALPSAYRSIVIGIVAAGLLTAIGAALATIREHRLLRYLGLAAALAIGTAYAVVTSTGVPEIDAVERFHFLEYGLLTLLFYRVWVERADLTTFALPFGAAFATGTADEAMQWFVPLRVGELHDVLLNGVAIACGLMFATALAPPRGVSRAIGRSTGGQLMLAAMLTVYPCAEFVEAVHVGREVSDVGIGVFRSNFDAQELLAAATERTSRWTAEPPLRVRRLSREDRYLNEALWHIEERNELWAVNDYVRAWHENLILERYFTPILDIPTYATPNGARWPESQRAAAMAAVEAQAVTYQYISAAHPYPIYLWNTLLYRLAVLALLGIIWFVCLKLPANASTSSTAPSIT